MNNKTRMSLVGTGLIALMVVSACSKEGGSEGSSKTEDKTPFELIFYTSDPAGWAQDKFDLVFKEALKQKFPWITVKITSSKTTENPELPASVEEYLASGERIDVVLASAGTAYEYVMKNQLQLDISPYIKKYEYNMNRFPDAIVKQAESMAGSGKGIMGLPFAVAPQALYYNVDIFDKFGVSYPKDGMTWDDVYQLSKRLNRKEGETQYFGFGFNALHESFLNQWSMPLLDQTTVKSTLDTNPRWTDWINYFVRFYSDPAYATLKRSELSWTAEVKRFTHDHTSAMLPTVTSLYTDIDLQGMKWGVVSHPVFAGTDLGPQPYPQYLFITSMNKHAEDTFQVLNYLTSEEFQMQASQKGHFLTSLKDPKIRAAFGQNEPQFQGKNVQAFWPKNYADATWIGDLNGSGWGARVSSAMLDVIFNVSDTNTALRKWAEEMNQRVLTLQGK
ncbi:ABC transporter substrate-binding protein [Paenibacillus hemerocallicola]|nr:ABC transporter substrate-binding protein [Paenibacillus hemerocallicola]